MTSLSSWAASPDANCDVSVHRSVYSVFKRNVDILGSLVGLSVVALILVPVAIAIKLDSPGPIFYRQKRCGLQGQPITIYKFRTMVNNADDLKHALQREGQPFFVKPGHDPRITRVGQLLRRTSLDEFPQFWNVLWGEMSLVGTRPPTMDEVKHYASHHWQRLRVKPGLTGEWQVGGRSNIQDFEAIVQMDLRYQERWTPLYDLVLIWKTIRVVLLGIGAA